MLPRSIAGRVLLASTVTLAVSIATVAVLAPFLAQRHEVDVLAERLRGDAEIAAGLASGAMRDGDADALDELARDLAARAGVRVTLIRRDGLVVGESHEDRRVMDDHSSRPEVAEALQTGSGRSVRRSDTVASDLLYVAVPVRDAGNVIGVARVALPVATLDALAARLAAAIVGAAVAGGVVALGLAVVLGRAVARPLGELARRAREGTITDWVDSNAPTEVAELAATLGRVSADVRRLEVVRQEFVANVSHELRTPIASLKAMVEALEAGAIRDPVAARDFVARMHTEVDDLAQLVGELLALSRVESGEDAPRFESIPPEALIGRAVSRLRPLAERASVRLEGMPVAPLPPVRADPEKVGQVLANLVHNAIKFTPAGGSVEVSARREVGAVRFEVSDTGTGIPREEIERVFERFFKGERSRAGGGTGLGLAIAKHIVQAHGGTIDVRSEGAGRGSTFGFTLPTSGPAGSGRG